MSDVDYHLANLWFAGQQENWPLAEFYLNETRSHLNWAVRLRPVRKLSNGAELDVGAMLKGIDRKMIDSCHGCHTAAEKPYLRPHIPEAPASRMIDFSSARAVSC